VFVAYYRLVKPGIVYGNVLNGLTGFGLASFILGHFDLTLLAALAAGLGLVIASSCVFNNYIDRSIDAKMSRTKKRALVQKQIPAELALVYATVLGIVGLAILMIDTNWLTVGCAAFGMFAYVVVYGYFKRTSIYGTLIGGISGAMPPVIGYVTVTDHFDAAALSLFLMLVCWQIPHFFAIATYRRDEYAAAGLPVWPVKKDFASTRKQMIYYMVGFSLAALLLAVYHYTGVVYAIVMIGLSLGWLRLALRKTYLTDVNRWARQIFGFSLIITLAMTFIIPFGAILP